ncbi:MAG: hypothetical protein SGI90_04045 [Candidatus Eisenbacteria bacterium]|nr:hypothetical protein [Candidatus Eisenbacteria bacterium]
MNRSIYSLLILTSIAWLAVGTADGRSYMLEPTQVIACSGEKVGPARLILTFDFTTFPKRSGWQVQDAFLEWRTAARPSAAAPRFIAYPIIADWIGVDVAQGRAPLLDLARSSEWEIEPLDVERMGGGFVRLDVSAMVKNWVLGLTLDKGILVEADSLPLSVLMTESAGMRLHVLYAGDPR